MTAGWGFRSGLAASIPKTELSVEIPSQSCKLFVRLLLIVVLPAFILSKIPKMVSASLVLFM
jgi:hypothetical protein